MNDTANETAQAPFVVILLTTLRVVKFQTKLEMVDAITSLRERDIKYIVLKYHHGAATYVVPEIYE